jgi:hypothetical protein
MSKQKETNVCRFCEGMEAQFRTYVNPDNADAPVGLEYIRLANVPRSVYDDLMVVLSNKLLSKSDHYAAIEQAFQRSEPHKHPELSEEQRAYYEGYMAERARVQGLLKEYKVTFKIEVRGRIDVEAPLDERYESLEHMAEDDAFNLLGLPHEDISIDWGTLSTEIEGRSKDAWRKEMEEWSAQA